jgi:hypothetical protein
VRDQTGQSKERRIFFFLGIKGIKADVNEKKGEKKKRRANFFGELHGREEGQIFWRATHEHDFEPCWEDLNFLRFLIQFSLFLFYFALLMFSAWIMEFIFIVMSG